MSIPQQSDLRETTRLTLTLEGSMPNSTPTPFISVDTDAPLGLVISQWFSAPATLLHCRTGGWSNRRFTVGFVERGTSSPPPSGRSGCREPAPIGYAKSDYHDSRAAPGRTHKLHPDNHGRSSYSGCARVHKRDYCRSLFRADEPIFDQGIRMTVRQGAIAPTNDTGGRSTKDDWLNLAIETLISEGIDQVKVQVMAKKLGVSRSSFYWFFESIQDLQDQLLDYWLSKNTGPIIERAMRPAATINKAVCNVFECWVDDNLFQPDLDIAIRYWGRREPRIRSVLDEADRQRVSALTRMFKRFQYPDEEAFTRARVLYYTQIGHFALQVQEPMRDRFSHVPSYLLTFTGAAPTTRDIEALESIMSRS